MADPGSNLLRDVGRLLSRSHDLEETLQNVVRLVARWMHAGVCSIYLLEEDGRTLVLRATRGLRPEAVGAVKLERGQGIIGACLQRGEPIAVADVRLDTRFRAFPLSGEERFRSMLAVPLFVRRMSIGVLSVQTRRTRSFSAEEIELIETIASQVATIVLNARLLDQAFREGSVGAPAPEHRPVAIQRGSVVRATPISPGIAIGPVHVQAPPVDLLAVRYEPSKSPRAEWRAIERALREAARQLSDLRSTVGDRFGDEFAEVFTTHIMILEDQGFREKVHGHLDEHGHGVRALFETMREYTDIFKATGDPTIRERAVDVEDVVRRAVGELIGVREHNPPLRHGVIVVADRIAPSEFMLLETEKIAGLATVHGGTVSHAAIFARSLEIPAVTALPASAAGIRPTDRLIIDGIDGAVIVNPTPDQLADYGERRLRYARMMSRLGEIRSLPAEMPEGDEVLLSANIGGLTDLEHVQQYGARGIGLFRTEILVLSSRRFPDEDEQARIYRRASRAAAPYWVTVRTFDLGGDKGFGDQSIREDNPQLGWRSIRMLLDMQPVFESQIRAILRANELGNLRVMIPMITSLEELDATRETMHRIQQQIGVATAPPLGVMIETPAAAAIADRIAPHVDFMSIGTNDLTQYTLAVDRENERVADLYDPFHPGVLMQIQRVADVARERATPVSVCGELAGNPAATPVLLGMGIRELSMTPFSILGVLHVVRSCRRADVEALAADVVRLGRASDVRKRILQTFEDIGLLEDREFAPALKRLLRLHLVDSPRGRE